MPDRGNSLNKGSKVEVEAMGSAPWAFGPTLSVRTPSGKVTESPGWCVDFASRPWPASEYARIESSMISDVL